MGDADCGSLLWGVLVSTCPPTSANGLATYARQYQRLISYGGEENQTEDERDGKAEVLGGGKEEEEATGEPSRQKEDGMSHSAGVAALIQLIPPSLRQRYFYTTTVTAGSSPSTTVATTKAEATVGEEGEKAFVDDTAHLVSVPRTVVLPLFGACVRVGRQPGNDIALSSNPCISVVHCAFSVARSAHGEDHNLREMGEEADEDRPPFEQSSRSEPPSPPLPPSSRATGSPSIVTLTDFSKNGCYLNGKVLGHGVSHRPVHSGDKVELVNAGKRHIADYNLAFTYLCVKDFAQLLANQLEEATRKKENDDGGGDDGADDTQLSTRAPKQQTPQRGSGKPPSSSPLPPQTAGVPPHQVPSTASLKMGVGGQPDSAKKLVDDGSETTLRGGGGVDPSHEPNGSATRPSAAAPDSQQQRKASARREALLRRARWNVAGQIRRMYHHDVLDFYLLDEAHPLGEGGFGKVFPATLRPSTAASTAKVVSSVLRADDGGDDDEEAKETYIAGRANEAPPSVVAAMARAPAAPTAEVTASPLSDPFPFAVKIVAKKRELLEALEALNDETDTGQNGDASSTSAQRIYVAGQELPLTRSEKLVLRALAQLETQVDDHAMRREHDWLAHQQRLLDQLSSPHHQRQQQQSSSPSSFDPGSGHSQRGDGVGGGGASSLSQFFAQTDVLGMPMGALQYPSSQGAVAGFSGASDAAAIGPTPSTPSSGGSFTQQEHQRRVRREDQRKDLLARLTPALRKYYTRELQQQRRLQCEINILLAVKHENVTRLYEVFDSTSRLSLVMEKATGGEVWDLLQPKPADKAGAPSSPPHAAGSDGGGVVEEDGEPAKEKDSEEEDEEEEGEEVAGSMSGGPLPEFFVKIIIVQVLEAVVYLHSMGIVHRDLKLENLLLATPCHVPTLCAHQLDALVHKLTEYTAHMSPSSSPSLTSVLHASSTATTNTTTTAKQFIANPLSLVHYVHLPRSVWPTVKISDFGLSRILGNVPTLHRVAHLSSAAAAAASDESKRPAHELAAAEEGSATANAAGGGTAAASEDAQAAAPPMAAVLAQVYARNDMTTSCGTALYAAPEVTHKDLRLDRVGYGPAVDLFSVGVIAFGLLTGRTPFPFRTRPGGHSPVMDYNAPLSFERYRKRRPGGSAARGTTEPSTASAHTSEKKGEESKKTWKKAYRTGESSTTPKRAEPSPSSPPRLIPALALREHVDVRFTTTVSPERRKRPRSETVSHAEDDRLESGWKRDMQALELRVAKAELRTSGARAETAGGASSHPPSPPPQQQQQPVVFADTMRETVAVLSSYAARRRRKHYPVDIERLYLASWNAATAQSAPKDAAGAVVDSSRQQQPGGPASSTAARADRIALPPISPLGQHFLSALLQANPSRRMTAYEALQHPWLHDCRYTMATTTTTTTDS